MKTNNIKKSGFIKSKIKSKVINNIDKYYNSLIFVAFSGLYGLVSLFWSVFSMMWWTETSYNITQSLTILQKYTAVAEYINNKSLLTHFSMIVFFFVAYVIFVAFFVAEENKTATNIKCGIYIFILGTIFLFFDPLRVVIHWINVKLGILINYLTNLACPVKFIPWIVGSVILILGVLTIKFVYWLKKVEDN